MSTIEEENYHDRILCTFADAAYKQMVAKRYGLGILKKVDTKLFIKKELLGINNIGNTDSLTDTYIT